MPKILRRRLWDTAGLFLILAFILLFLFPAAAFAAAGVRVEWMKGPNVLGAQTVASSGASVASSAAPSFGGVAGSARFTVTEGAVVVYCCAADPTATQTNGFRLQAGDPPYIINGLAGGTKFAVIEAADPPTGDGGAATETTLQAAVTELEGLRTDLATPADSLPPQAPAAKGDATYALVGANISTATDTALITATAAQTGRLHSIFCTVAGAQTITFKDGASAFTGGGPFNFPSGGGVLQWNLRAHPYFATSANTALNITTTTTAAVSCRGDAVKD